MSKLKTLHTRVLIFVIFLFTSTRMTIGRIWPFTHATDASEAKVFALTDAEWQELREGRDVPVNDKKDADSGDKSKDASRRGDEKQDQAGKDKSEGKCNTPKSANDAQKTDAADQDSSGGGDGDTGGGGG